MSDRGTQRESRLLSLAAGGVGMAWLVACGGGGLHFGLAGALSVASLVAFAVVKRWAHRRMCEPGKSAAQLRSWLIDYTAEQGWLASKPALPEGIDAPTSRALVRLHQTMYGRAKDEQDASEELNREMGLQMRLVALASHDLRSPLNSITGFADILGEEMDGPLNEPQRASVRAIRHASEDLLSLVTGILDCARLEAGLLEVHLELNECAPVLAEALDRATVRVGEPIAARMHLARDLGVIAMDRARVVQALAAVFEHIARVSQEPIELEASRDGEHLLVTLLSVGLRHDATGVFDAFRAVRDSAGGRIPGLGFGLSLARGLIRLHGGELEYESRGSGAAFVLRL